MISKSFSEGFILSSHLDIHCLCFQGNIIISTILQYVTVQGLILTSLSFPQQFGRTEVIDNTLNPDFVRKFILDYFFEERENLRFDL